MLSSLFGCHCCCADDKSLQSSKRVEVTAIHSRREAARKAAGGSESLFFLPPSSADFLEFSISVEKGSEELRKVGLEISRAPTFLKVKKVGPGLIEDHNKRNPHEAVLENDAIVAVNGQSGRYDALLNLISRETKLELTIRRAVYSQTAAITEFEPNVAEEVKGQQCEP